MRYIRRALVALVTVLLAVGTTVATVAPASATGPTCTASSQATFSPGLLLTPTTQDISFTAGYSNCVSTSRPDITSGTRTGTFTGERGCLSVLPPSASGTFEVTWNTGEKSTVTGTSTGQDVAGQTVLTLTGVVVSGPFVGASFTEVLVQSNLNLLGCLAAPGVQSQSGVGTLAVL